MPRVEKAQEKTKQIKKGTFIVPSCIYLPTKLPTYLLTYLLIDAATHMLT